MNCFNVEYVHIKHNVLHNIEKVLGKYILYSYMFDTEDHLLDENGTHNNYTTRSYYA